MRTLALLSMLVLSQHKPWYTGTQGTGATQWIDPSITIRNTYANASHNASGAAVTVVINNVTLVTGDVVVAMVTHARDSSNTITSVVGSSLGTMTQRVTQYGGAGQGEARIYANAYAGAGTTTETITLTVDNSAASGSQAITVSVVSGANTTALSTTGTNSQAITTAGTVSVTATGPRSYLFGCAQGSSGGFTATAGTDTTELSDQPDIINGNDSNYAFRSTSTGGSGSRTLAWTWATTTLTDSAAIEIKSP